MKRPALKAGLLVFVFLATLAVQPTVSALTKPDFNLGNINVSSKPEGGQTETDAQVLSETTDEAKSAETTQPEQAAKPAEVIVEIAKGDSLSKIASNYGTTFQRLFDANTFIADPNVINPGDKVRIPSAEEQLVSRPLPSVAKPAAAPEAAPKPKAKKASKPVSSNAPAVASGSVWDQLAKCESGGNWHINTGNGYYGGLQFTAGTWRAVGGTGLPHENSREEQILRAEILLARSGWGQWPACTKKLGLR